MIEEFEICLKNNVIPIPIGATGYVSKKLWEKVVHDLNHYYPSNNDLNDAIIELGREDLTKEELITNTVKAINILQKM